MPVQKRILAPKTSFSTPYYVVRGEKKGANMMIVAGIHGNERASVTAAKRLVRMAGSGSIRIRRGTLIIVPIVNQAAYRKNIRGVPDLNRTFPRPPGQPARHALSQALFRLAKQHGLSWYLDLHEANGLSELNPKRLGQTLIANSGNGSLPAAKRQIGRINRTIAEKSRHFNLRIRELPGSSRTAAARMLRARAVTVETCWSLNKAERVNYQTGMVKGFLREAGLM